MIVGADDSNDRVDARHGRHALSAPTGCGACTTRRTARSRRPRRCCRAARRRSCASTGSTRPTGCCATTATPSTSCCRRTARARSTFASIPKLAYALAHPQAFPGRRQRGAARDAAARAGHRRAQRRRASSRCAAGSAVRYADLRALGCDVSKAAAFVVTPDHRPPPRGRARPQRAAARHAVPRAGRRCGERDRTQARRAAPPDPYDDVPRDGAPPARRGRRARPGRCSTRARSRRCSARSRPASRRPHADARDPAGAAGAPRRRGVPRRPRALRRDVPRAVARVARRARRARRAHRRRRARGCAAMRATCATRCHRMHAFVRFRAAARRDAALRRAGCDTDHDVLRRAAPFFVDRFATHALDHRDAVASPRTGTARARVRRRPPTAAPPPRRRRRRGAVARVLRQHLQPGARQRGG